MIKVYFVPCLEQYNNWRTKIIIEQGLQNHPDVELVNSPGTSDFIFMNALAFPPNAFGSKDIYKFDSKKLVFIDFWDNPTGLFKDVKCLCYFKRSGAVPVKKNGFYVKSLLARPGIYPTTMAILDQFLFEGEVERDIDVGCYFNGKSGNINRDTIYQIAQGLNCKTSIGLVSAGGTSGRLNYDKNYFGHLKRSKITITCQPDRWDGDWRTWESLACGALTICDRIHAPVEKPLVDGEHCIFYDPTPIGFKKIVEKVHYYLEHEEERERMAKNGQSFAMKHHRSINRIDSMIKIAEKLKDGKKL